MDDHQIIYEFDMGDGVLKSFELRLDPDSLTLSNAHAETDLPDWTRLEHEQCPHCPLQAEDSPHCPVARSLVDLFDFANAFRSFDKLVVQVKSAERVVVTKNQAQILFGSLLGLLIATSGCPHSAFLRPMARYHLPFAEADETIYRVVSMYLLAQFFRANEGQEPDYELTGLVKKYGDLEIVNEHLARRLRTIAKTDATLNAVIALDTYAKMMVSVLEDRAEELKPLFAPYLDPEA